MRQQFAYRVATFAKHAVIVKLWEQPSYQPSVTAGLSAGSRLFLESVNSITGTAGFGTDGYMRWKFFDAITFVAIVARSIVLRPKSVDVTPANPGWFERTDVQQ